MADPTTDQESIDVADSGFHLPTHHHALNAAQTSLTSEVAPTTPSLLTSLLSLPPRAHKRRRGERFKHEPEEEAESSEASALTTNTQMKDGEERKEIEQRSLRERKFEYLDHTADIQLHSWGDTLIEALEQQVIAMFSYVTDLAKVDIDPRRTDTFEVKGHDLDSLLFTLLDEFLYRFATNEWIVRDVKIESLDLTTFTLRVTGYGEHFTLSKHTQGTEIKAITYSNMQIYVNGQRVKSDNDELRKRMKTEEEGDEAAAATEAAATTEEDANMSESLKSDLDESAAVTSSSSEARGSHGADIYVIVDI